MEFEEQIAFRLMELSGICEIQRDSEHKDASVGEIEISGGLHRGEDADALASFAVSREAIFGTWESDRGRYQLRGFMFDLKLWFSEICEVLPDSDDKDASAYKIVICGELHPVADGSWTGLLRMGISAGGSQWLVIGDEGGTEVGYLRWRLSPDWRLSAIHQIRHNGEDDWSDEIRSVKIASLDKVEISPFHLMELEDCDLHGHDVSFQEPLSKEQLLIELQKDFQEPLSKEQLLIELQKGPLDGRGEVCGDQLEREFSQVHETRGALLELLRLGDAMTPLATEVTDAISREFSSKWTAAKFSEMNWDEYDKVQFELNTLRGRWRDGSFAFVLHTRLPRDADPLRIGKIVPDDLYRHALWFQQLGGSEFSGELLLDVEGWWRGPVGFGVDLRLRLSSDIEEVAAAFVEYSFADFRTPWSAEARAYYDNRSSIPETSNGDGSEKPSSCSRSLSSDISLRVQLLSRSERPRRQTRPATAPSVLDVPQVRRDIVMLRFKQHSWVSDHLKSLGETVPLSLADAV